MSLHEHDRSSPVLSTLEEALLQYPGLRNDLTRQGEVVEELETKLFLLLNQHGDELKLNNLLQAYVYCILEIMLQQRSAPLSETACCIREHVPQHLRGISSCVDLEAEWLVAYPDVVLESQELADPLPE
ncbi:hypothetical protein RSAG8_07685, partial [Rhizoctonia solani AG-8 WAC10335]